MSTAKTKSPAAAPTTFAALAADAVPGRPLSGPARWARRLILDHPELTEAECVSIALGVDQGDRAHRRFFTAEGQWVLVGSSLLDQHLILLAGEKPGPEDA